MKVSDYIIKKLIDFGIDTVFGYTGGSIADIIDSIGKFPNMNYVQSYHEQASAFSANAYAQITGNIGVVVSSSGPGAINLINGIANAYYDSIPCVFITGNVHSCARKASPQIRQNAFQETDIVEMVKSITKYSVYVQNENDIKYILEKAFYIANDARKGPVLIDIPYDVQRRNVNLKLLKGFQIQNVEKDIEMQKVMAALMNSRRPLFLLGGGCHGAKQILKDMLNTVPIPAVVSMRGIDLISHQDRHYIGFIGTYGNLIANLAVRYSDLLIVLGSRLDERQMGYEKEKFAPCAKIIQVDIDENELGRKTDNLISICTSIENFMTRFRNVFADYSYSCIEWQNFLNKWQKKIFKKMNDTKEVSANNYVRKISKLFDEDAIISVDVGQNQIICAQSVMVSGSNNFLCSAGLACMGYSLPASIGAYYASRKRQIISINGDGGIMMNIQELQTIQREKIPIKIIILNNNCLGLIRELQENLFEERYFASICGYAAPNFSKIAHAFDLDYIEIGLDSDLSNCCSLLKNSRSVVFEIKLPYAVSTLDKLEKKFLEQQGRCFIENFEKQMERI